MLNFDSFLCPCKQIQVLLVAAHKKMLFVSLQSFYGVLESPNKLFPWLNHLLYNQGICTLLIDKRFWFSFSVFVICFVVYYGCAVNTFLQRVE